MTKAAANKIELLSMIQHGDKSDRETEREFLVNQDPRFM